MRWLLGDRRQGVPASVIAGGIFAEFVSKDEKAVPENFGVPPPFAAAFLKKAQLYREATALLVLINLAEEEKEYEQVLREYERPVFSATPSRQGVAKLEKVRSAMAAVAELVQPDSHALSWSVVWFSDIGFRECSPVDLTLFSSFWLSFYCTMTISIRAFRPE